MPTSTESSPVTYCKAEGGICINGEDVPCEMVCLKALADAASCIARAGVLTKPEDELGYAIDHEGLAAFLGDNTNG